MSYAGTKEGREKLTLNLISFFAHLLPPPPTFLLVSISHITFLIPIIPSNILIRFFFTMFPFYPIQ